MALMLSTAAGALDFPGRLPEVACVTRLAIAGLEGIWVHDIVSRVYEVQSGRSKETASEGHFSIRSMLMQ
jgi:hypothetical protein